MSKQQQENKDFFECLGFLVIRHIEKPTNKGFILYDIKKDYYRYNLSSYDLFDIITYHKTELLFDIVKNSNLLRQTPPTLETKKQILSELKTNKIYYELIRDIINVEKIIIDKIDYVPVKDQFVKKNGCVILNLWNFNKDFLNITPNINAKFQYLKRFLINLCGNNEEFYNKFIEVCAWKKQNPTKPLNQCNFIFQDNGGTGKSKIFLALFLKKIFNVEVISQIDLESNYNSFMANQEWVVVEEVEGYNDAKRIKHLTGADTIRVNEKFEKAFTTKNYSNMIIFSNDIRTLQIDEHDRRWNIGGGGKRLSPTATLDWNTTLFKTKGKNIEFFNNFHEKLEEELRNFYAYILALEVQEVEVQQLVNTIQRQELINMCKSSEKSFIDDIIENNLTDVIRENIKVNPNKIIDSFIHNVNDGVNNGYWVKLQDFYDLYLQFCALNQYTKKLTKKVFLKRLENYSEFWKIFSEYKLIKIDKENFRALKLKSYVDENIEITPSKEIVITKQKSL